MSPQQQQERFYSSSSSTSSTPTLLPTYKEAALGSVSYLFDDLSLPMFTDENNNVPLPTESPVFTDFSSPSTSISDDPVVFGSLDLDKLMFPQLPTSPQAHSMVGNNSLVSFSNGLPLLTTVVPPSPPSTVTSSPPTAPSPAALPQSTTWIVSDTPQAETGSSGNALTVPALMNALNLPAPTTDDKPAERPKSKCGRKRKPRPTDPDAIVAEERAKRAKNTEAARKSRLRKLQRFEEAEQEVVRLNEKLNASQDREAALETNENKLKEKISSLESMLSMCLQTMMNAGVRMPEVDNNMGRQ